MKISKPLNYLIAGVPLTKTGRHRPRLSEETDRGAMGLKVKQADSAFVDLQSLLLQTPDRHLFSSHFKKSFTGLKLEGFFSDLGVPCLF